MGKRRRSKPTLVAELHAEIQVRLRALATPGPDEAMTEALEDLAALITRLAQAPAVEPSDIALKLAVLCRRLREETHPEVLGEVVDCLLAESIRDDYTCHHTTAEGS